MSPAFLLALALQADAQPAQLDELKRAYEQSCTSRAYGTFDDVCTQMGDQIRAYERESRKAAARRPPAAPPAPPPALAAAGSPPHPDPAPSR